MVLIMKKQRWWFSTVLFIISFFPLDIIWACFKHYLLKETSGYFVVPSARIILNGSRWPVIHDQKNKDFSFLVCNFFKLKAVEIDKIRQIGENWFFTTFILNSYNDNIFWEKVIKMLIQNCTGIIFFLYKNYIKTILTNVCNFARVK